MIRKVLSGAGVLAMVVGGLCIAQAGEAAASNAPVTLSGNVTCAVTGAIKFSPPLVNGGTAAETVSVKAKLSSCSGPGTTNGTVTMTGGTLNVATGTTIKNNCGAVLNGSALPDMNGGVKWKATGGKVTSSTVLVHNGSAVYNPTGSGTIQVFLPSSVPSGSYAGETPAFTGLNSNKAGGTLDARCGGNGLRGAAIGKPGGTTTGSVTIQTGGS